MPDEIDPAASPQEEGHWHKAGLPVPGGNNDIFFAAVEKTRMPMIVTDPHQPDNPIIFANNAFINMTGYAPDELLGRNCRFLQGPETDQQTVAELREAVAERREMATEILNYRKNGSSFWNALFVSPVYDNDSQLLYFFGSQLDVSRRRDAEEALRRSQKMEALGQLTGGIAHDFNNLLQVMLGYLELSIGALEAPSFSRERTLQQLGHTQAAARRAATLTQQLLAFARKQRLEGRSINLNDSVGEMTELVQRTLGGDVAFRTELGERLWNSRLDSSQLEVAVLNLLINARDALEGREEKSVSIVTRNVELASDDPENVIGLASGRYVVLSVKDNGIGMTESVRLRVMDPFFTTKEEGKGTGLGLSMVYGFVKQSGGAVAVASAEDSGTTVSLYFPATDNEIARAGDPPGRPVDHSGDETILLVEDRSDVAGLARAFLESFGYSVLRASEGRQALKILSEHSGVDLLFSDLIMPGGMNGVSLAREARRRQPGLKVLLTTGYSEASIERVDAGGSEFEIINKPYRQHELARKVRQVLEGPNGVS